MRPRNCPYQFSFDFARIQCQPFPATASRAARNDQNYKLPLHTSMFPEDPNIQWKIVPAIFAKRHEDDVVAQMLRIKYNILHIVIQEPQTVCPNKVRKKKKKPPPLGRNNIPKTPSPCSAPMYPKTDLVQTCLRANAHAHAHAHQASMTAKTTAAETATPLTLATADAGLRASAPQQGRL